MILTLLQLKRVAYLARLDVGDDEAQDTMQRLNAVLTLIGEMQSVDTEGVEPMSHTQDMAQRLREDVPVNEDWRAVFQAIAPETEEGCYLVPRVIE